MIGWPDERFSLQRPEGGELTRAGRLLRLLARVALGVSLAGSIWFLVTLLITSGRSGSAAGGIFFTICLAVFLIVLVVGASDEWRRLAYILYRREVAGRAVFALFRDRWLGLWAPTDEAILGLQALAPTDTESYESLCADPAARQPVTGTARPITRLLPLPREPLGIPPEDNYLFPRVSPWTGRTIRALLYPLLNRLLIPWLRSAADALVKSAQGCDLAGTVLAYASPWPLPLSDLPDDKRDDRQVGLPKEALDRLENHARRQAAAMGPQLRQVLVQAALTGTPLHHYVLVERPTLTRPLGCTPPT